MIRPVTLAILVLVLTVIYVAAMQAGLAGYRAATLLYIFLIGAMLSMGNRKLLVGTSLLSVVLSFGLHYIFTRIFVIDLP